MLASLVSAPPAAAKTPCWQRVINDWVADERIDGTYAQHCCRDAINHVPEDLRDYSSIVEDINAACRREVVRTPQSRGSGVPPATSPSAKGKTTARTEPKRGLFKVAFDKIGPRNADSVPLPLVILAGLALLLIAGGAVGLVTHRLRGRRLTPPGP